jgi:hypothetical protein
LFLEICVWEDFMINSPSLRRELAYWLCYGVE